MGSFSIWHWLIFLAIVVVIFGTKKLANAGKDVGSGIRNFKDAMREGQTDAEQHVAAVRQNLGMNPPPAPPPAGTAGTAVPVITPVNADGTPRT